MTPAKGYYCLIQYCPDQTRLEAATIGVLLFRPERTCLGDERQTGATARSRRQTTRANCQTGLVAGGHSRYNSSIGGPIHECCGSQNPVARRRALWRQAAAPSLGSSFGGAAIGGTRRRFDGTAKSEQSPREAATVAGVAADVRFIGHGENGATTLYFEAPVLGKAAREIYQQQQLPGFSTRPSPDDTGFDLLGDVLADVQRRDADSGNYDDALLSRIARFHKVLDRKSPYCEIDFTSRRYSAEQPAKVTRDTITSAKSLLRRTPAPQRLRVVGQLDGLEASTQRFSVLLDTGEKVVGVFADDQMDAMRELWRKQVLVLGTAIYRASGRLLRIDAEIVKPGDAEARIFSRMPTPSHGRLNVSKLRRPQGPRSGMAAIMGRWPGDEFDEEIEAALQRLS